MEYRNELIQETEKFIHELKSRDKKNDSNTRNEKPSKTKQGMNEKENETPTNRKVTDTKEEGSQIELCSAPGGPPFAPGGPPLVNSRESQLLDEARGGVGTTALAERGGNNGASQNSLIPHGNDMTKSNDNSQSGKGNSVNASIGKNDEIRSDSHDKLETKMEGSPKHVKIDSGLQKLRNENLKLKEAKLCRICRDKDANRMFLPCAHLAACSLCSPAVVNCPQCRGVIRGVVSVYFG